MSSYNKFNKSALVQLNKLTLSPPILVCPEKCCLLFMSAALYSSALQTRFHHEGKFNTMDRYLTTGA